MSIVLSLILAFTTMTAVNDDENHPFKAYDQQGEDIIPIEFQGDWAPSKSDCNNKDGVNSLHVFPKSISSYESRAKLIKHAGSTSDWTVGEEMGDSVRMLVAQSGEGDVDITRYRLFLLNDKLYLDVGDDAKKPVNTKAGGYVRCKTNTN